MGQSMFTLDSNLARGQWQSQDKPNNNRADLYSGLEWPEVRNMLSIKFTFQGALRAWKILCILELFPSSFSCFCRPCNARVIRSEPSLILRVNFQIRMDWDVSKICSFACNNMMNGVVGAGSFTHCRSGECLVLRARQPPIKNSPLSPEIIYIVTCVQSSNSGNASSTYFW